MTNTTNAAKQVEAGHGLGTVHYSRLELEPMRVCAHCGGSPGRGETLVTLEHGWCHAPCATAYGPDGRARECT